MNAVEVQISLPVLHKLLHLPADVYLTKVSQTYQEQVEERFSVVAEGPGLSEVGPGQEIPWGNIIIHTEWCNTEERVHIVSGEVKSI